MASIRRLEGRRLATGWALKVVHSLPQGPVRGPRDGAGDGLIGAQEPGAARSASPLAQDNNAVCLRYAYFSRTHWPGKRTVTAGRHRQPARHPGGSASALSPRGDVRRAGERSWSSPARLIDSLRYLAPQATLAAAPRIWRLGRRKSATTRGISMKLGASLLCLQHALSQYLGADLRSRRLTS